MTYLAVVRIDPKHDFRIEFPDFPTLELACPSVGDAQPRAEKAVRAALARAAREGEKPPTPTSKQQLEGRPEYHSSFLVQVEVSA